MNEVIHKYFEDRFICVDMKDEWFYFNGTRWERTMKANELKRRIHGEIWDIYKLEADKYRAQDNDVGADICLSFQKKLLREEYVSTLIKGLGHMFYKKDIMEEFDTNHMIQFMYFFFVVSHHSLELAVLSNSACWLLSMKMGKGSILCFCSFPT